VTRPSAADAAESDPGASETIGDDTPLSQLTTMRVGGPAERILVARSGDELVRCATELWHGDEPWLLLGGGSNTVMNDEGFPGAVLLVRSTGMEVVDDPEQPEGRVRLRVQAGHDWDALVAACVERGWSGVEALSGIPGLAGAAPVQNIGAYGQELSDVLHSIEFLDRESGEVRRLVEPAAPAGRHAAPIEAPAAGDALSEPVRYAQLAAALGVETGDRVPVRQLRDAVLRLRASKGMVLDPDDHDTWSAGSFFTNPIVTERFARTFPENAPRFPVGDDEPAPAVTTLEELAAGVPMRFPQPAPERRIKLSAAWLIENSGVPRGFRLPGSGAAISSKHTLAITNRGGATAAQVAELARFVVQRVQQEFGVILAPEPNLYGLEL
jgi:UDP-N-acetylmuramate dehydrogenase